MEKRQHVLPLLSLNGRELWIQALLPLQMGQNQRTEELAQFLHQIGTRRNGHTTLVMPLKLHQKMICPVVGLRAGQHTGAALIRQMAEAAMESGRIPVYCRRKNVRGWV